MGLWLWLRLRLAAAVALAAAVVVPVPLVVDGAVAECDCGCEYGCGCGMLRLRLWDSGLDFLNVIEDRGLWLRLWVGCGICCLRLRHPAAVGFGFMRLWLWVGCWGTAGTPMEKPSGFRYGHHSTQCLLAVILAVVVGLVAMALAVTVSLTVTGAVAVDWLWLSPWLLPNCGCGF